MTELNLKKTQQSYCHHKNCDYERMEIMSKDSSNKNMGKF